MQFNLRHKNVLAFAQTEAQDGKSCGIILVWLRPNEWVTAWYREGDEQWCLGEYCSTIATARESFIRRTTEKWGSLPAPQQPANGR